MELVEEYCIGDQQHQNILSLLNEQRLQNTFSDVVLIADETKFPAHRCILAAASEYFRSMFEEDHFAECKTKEIQLHSISKEALKVILELIYLGHMTLTVSNMHSVLEASDHLLLSNAKWFCVTFMLKVLQSEGASKEVLKIRHSADVFSLPDLKHQAELLIQQKFDQVTKSHMFVELTCEEVIDIISLDDSEEMDEFVYFEACMRWICHMTEDRLQHLDQIMQYVRFSLMPAEVLIQTIRPHPWVSKSPTCLSYIQEALDYQILTDHQSLSQNLRTKPRCSRNHRGLVYCIVGTKHFKCYVPQHNQWYSLRAPPLDGLCIPEGKTLNVRLLSLNGYVFATVQMTNPEEVGHLELVSLLVYDITVNEWRACSLPEKSSLNSGRLVVITNRDSRLYACSRQCVYMYSMETDIWEVHSEVDLDPCQFVVSSDSYLYFYNLEAGILQTVWLNKQSEQEATAPKHVILTPNRFIADVQGCTKLPNSEVFLQLRTITGMSRKVFNIRTNLWRDFCISYGMTPLQPRASVHYPLVMDPRDQWEVVCDKRQNCLYVLALKSGLSDIPMKGKPTLKQADAALPFYRLDVDSREWKRLACLPESLSVIGGLQMCISDGEDSMAVA